MKPKQPPTPQEREDARDIAVAKKVLRSPSGKLIAESKVLKELGRVPKVHR